MNRPDGPNDRFAKLYTRDPDMKTYDEETVVFAIMIAVSAYVYGIAREMSGRGDSTTEEAVDAVMDDITNIRKEAPRVEETARYVLGLVKEGGLGI